MTPDAAVSLEVYDQRRDFSRTSEPPGLVRRSRAALTYVIQKHDASRLHYDLRLEMGGVYRSWAVPKGPSLDPKVRRLAVETEDHPLAYGTFEGIIPEGEYGGGTVMLWDTGAFVPEGDPVAGYEQGHIKFVLDGARLHGGFHLVRTKNQDGRKPTWLLFKSKDGHAHAGGTPEMLSQESVKTGRSLAEIARAGGEGAMPSIIPPALCRSAAAPPSGSDWIHEPKIDGYRIMIRKEGQDVRLFTRTGLDWTDRFTDVADAARALPVYSVILDGEIAVHDDAGRVRFDALQRALSTGGTTEGVVCHVFDCLFLEGQDLRPLPLLTRKEVVFALLAESGEQGLLVAVAHDVGDGAPAFQRAVEQKLEGIVSKRKDSPYTSGRSDAWQKVKTITREQFVVIGFGESKDGPRRIGSLLLASKTGNGLTFVGKVGTGFTESDKHDLFAQLAAHERDTPPVAPRPKVTGHVYWVEPHVMVEVAFGSVTAAGMLRHASYQGLRHDDLEEQPDEIKEPVMETTPTVARTAAISRRAPVGRRAAVRGPTAARLPRGAIDVIGVMVTSPDRVIYEGGITKRMLAEYIAAVAPLMLPHVERRPLSVVRCPTGSTGHCFFQKHLGATMPASVKSIVVPEGIGSKGSTTAKTDNVALTVEDAAGLVGLVQMGVLEIHPWGAAPGAPEVPDRIIFDLDPAEGLEWDRVCAAARDVRKRLQRDGLEAFVKSTGGKGLHVEVPLTPGTATWDEVKVYARALAERMATETPAHYTSNLRKDARIGRTFVDYLRNGRGATAIAPYSMRATRPTVAVPLHWDEIDDFTIGSVTVLNLHEHFERQKTRPWAKYLTTEQELP